MEVSKIKKLIENFYNGETGKEDELALLAYFSGDEVAEELLGDKEIFLQIYDTDIIKVPEDLESNLNILIDRLDDREKAQKKQSRKKLWIQISSIAATVALLISVTVYFNQKTDIVNDIPEVVTVSAEDQQKIRKAQEALVFLSSKFNKGIDELSVVSVNFDKTNEILNKTFNRKKHKES